MIAFESWLDEISKNLFIQNEENSIIKTNKYDFFGFDEEDEEE